MPSARILASLLGPVRNCVRFGDGAVPAADEPRPPLAIQFSLDRPIDAARRAVRDGGGRRPVQRGRPRGHHQYRQRIAGRHCARRRRHQRFRAGRHQRADALSRQGQAGRPPVKAVFVLFNKAPYAIIARKSRGIQRAVGHRRQERSASPKAICRSGCGRRWPAERHQDRERQAEQHQRRGARADAVGGPGRCRHRIFLSVGGQSGDRGVPADDLAVLRFADYGCEAYGFAVIVNPALAAAKPEAVKGFVRAVIGGTQLAIKDPAARRDRSRRAGWTAARATSSSSGCARDPARQHPDRRGQAQRHRRHRPGALRALDRSDRRGFQIPEAAAGRGYFRRPVPAAAQRPPDQLSKTSADAGSRAAIPD